MRSFNRSITLSLLAFGLLASERAHAAVLFRDPQFPVKVTNDIRYGTGEVRYSTTTERPLLLDLYQPEVHDWKTKHPVVIAIHGGGFFGGDKAEMSGLCRQMAARGYVCVSINYRLMEDNSPAEAPDQFTGAIYAAVQDAETAARWIERHAAAYKIDTGKMVVAGASAGAVTSLALAYSPKVKNLKVRAVGDLWGTLGPRVHWIHRGGPPIFIVHGGSDPVISVADARQIAARAEQAGVPHEVHIIEGMGHGVPLNFDIGGETLLQRLADFFYKELNLKSQARTPQE